MTKRSSVKLSNIERLHLLVMNNQELTLGEICNRIYGVNDLRVQNSARVLIHTYRKRLYDTHGLSFYYDATTGTYKILQQAAAFRRIYNQMNAAVAGTKKAMERLQDSYKKSVEGAQEDLGTQTEERKLG